MRQPVTHAKSRNPIHKISAKLTLDLRKDITREAQCGVTVSQSGSNNERSQANDIEQ